MRKKKKRAAIFYWKKGVYTTCPNIKEGKCNKLFSSSPWLTLSVMEGKGIFVIEGYIAVALQLRKLIKGCKFGDWLKLLHYLIGKVRMFFVSSLVKGILINPDTMLRSWISLISSSICNYPTTQMGRCSSFPSCFPIWDWFLDGASLSIHHKAELVVLDESQ